MNEQDTAQDNESNLADLEAPSAEEIKGGPSDGRSFVTGHFALDLG